MTTIPYGILDKAQRRSISRTDEESTWHTDSSPKSSTTARMQKMSTAMHEFNSKNVGKSKWPSMKNWGNPGNKMGINPEFKFTNSRMFSGPILGTYYVSLNNMGHESRFLQRRRNGVKKSSTYWFIPQPQRPELSCSETGSKELSLGLPWMQDNKGILRCSSRP